MSALLRPVAAAALLALTFLSTAVSGAFIDFQNCLDSAIVNSNPRQLQFVPLFFDAKFERASPYNLNVTIYGNVSGQQYVGTYPPPNSPHWKDDKAVLGKIPATGDANINTTLFADFTVLTYTAYNAKASSFCPHLTHGSCPLGPSFYANSSDPYDLSAFQVSHGFGSLYEFSTLDATITLISGDHGGPTLACVSANITPALGSSITTLITWLPAAILILKGVATLAAAMWSPWGSFDIFTWSSNYGRDEDLLRLVTPGFGDCLQYIQFATLMGGLTLSFPGFFQPALSNTAWSLLLFNTSYVSHGRGTQSLVDGVYATHGVYGLDIMYQLIGMSEAQDLWACMAIWLAVIGVGIVLLCQLGFFSRWVYRAATRTSEEDLRRKNLPFTLGNMNRLLFNYFILPIVALSLFQLVIAPISRAVVVGFAAALLIAFICCIAWILRFIFTTKPRTYLFDDMPTVLLYGPLYNTYSDSAAPFALVPVLITFMRGVAFGAVQPSGTGQVVILAICEIILIVTLNGFRPFQGQTSMNAYHTFFAVVRLIAVLLCIAFIPALGVTEAPKGWIGYVILLLHACVLVFGFFLNAAQTLLEVFARSLGLAGHDAQTGAVRGSILSWRMLKQRKARPPIVHRTSMASNAAMLGHPHVDEVRSWNDGRSRSVSLSSQQLLNRNATTPNSNLTNGTELFGHVKTVSNTDTDGLGALSYVASDAGKPGLGIKAEETFYRPPRPRKNTVEMITAKRNTQSFGSTNDFPYQDSPSAVAKRGSTGSPAPAYLRERPESEIDAPRTDYAVREVDQYYRGPALSDLPTRKLKTGPADPEGPAANAQSWFQRLMFGVKGNKRKEQAKGFEVVRSSRLPPGMQPQDGPADETMEMQTSPPMTQEPYHDALEHVTVGAERPVSVATGVSVERPLSGERPMSSGRRSSLRRPVSPLTEEELRATGRPRLVSMDSFDADFYAPGGLSGTSAVDHRGTRSIRPDSDTLGRAQIGRVVSGPRVRQSQTRPSFDTRPSHDSARPSTAGGADADPFRPSAIPPTLGPIESVGGIDLPSRFNSRRTQNSTRPDAGTDAEHREAWLRDVDNLNWSHSTSVAADQQQLQRPAVNRLNTGPDVPRRSSRRQGSRNLTPTGLPRTGDAVVTGGGALTDFDFGRFDFDHDQSSFLPVGVMGHDHTGGNPGANPYLFDDEDGGGYRPSSVMNTSRHRAADSITRNSFGANAALQATSAELMASSPPEHYSNLNGGGGGGDGGLRRDERDFWSEREM